ncbi:YD repeat-containing protein [Pedobacter sp. W3I1]|uniref:RHS repeat protein n=1 Tax=Pedobacter sp. W3I1 TaxID=3042291 RepID=UPI00277ECD1C|nr:RHS repeat domain-containing protein [Pedobacter sp. W3I1]MDQ0638328.1 YD repeat-containing protein [Pedobacter sp. W3I1]
MKYIFNFICVRAIIFVAFIFDANISFCQFNPNNFANGILPNVAPVSSEAYSLGKFGEWPVSLYTGLANIEIPIYQLKIGGFGLPVQLSYHSGGIKVDEVPSWVGTGWALNAGGAITRSIVGLADDGPNGFLSKNKRNEFLQSSYNLNDPNDYVTLRKASEGLIDTEPDIFYYNFAGRSGKFYFDKQGNFQAIPVNSLKLLVSPLTNSFSSIDKHWEIADEEGNVFYFGSFDYAGNGNEVTKTLPDGIPRQTTENLSAWYLTKIVLKNNADVVYFDYIEKFEQYFGGKTYSYKTGNLDYFTLSNNKISEEQLNTNIILHNGVPLSEAPGVTSIVNSGKSVLKKIRWNGGEMVFDAPLNRSDITGKNLTSVIVNDKIGQKIKETRFFYSAVNQRFFLDSLTEYGSDNIRKSSHVFEYNKPNELPVMYSNAQDHWGYYNGANSNTHLLPQLPELNNSLLNANREPEESFMQYGVLKRIHYPTGGYSEFEYEANRYDAADVPGGGNPSGPIISTTSVVMASDPQSGTIPRTRTFSIPFAQNTASIKLEFRDYMLPARKIDGWLPSIRIERLVNQAYQQIYYWDAFDNFPGNPQPKPNGAVDFDINQILTLPVGDYRIVTDLVCSRNNCSSPALPSIRATLNYQTYGSSGPSATNPVAGGLRIKQIAGFVNGQVASRSQYTYVPGKLLIYPKYLHEYGEDIWKMSEYYTNPDLGWTNLCTTLFIKYKEVVSSGQTILAFTQGSPVGYINVKESNISQEGIKNGYTEYEYSLAQDILNPMNIDHAYWNNTLILDKAAPLNSSEYKRGLLLKRKTYKRNVDESFAKVSELENTYEFNDLNTTNRYNSLRAMRVKKMRAVNYPCGNGNYFYTIPPDSFSPDFAYTFYDLITGWVQSRSSIETVYDLNGQNPVSTTTQQYYDNPFHLQVTRTEKADSKGSLEKRSFLYPNEMVSLGRDLTGVFAKMVAKNNISPVIEQKVVKNTSQETTVTTYKDWCDDGQIIQPEYITTQSGAGDVEPRFRFYGYNNTGHLRAASQEYGSRTVYLYSYNNQHTIAEIKNADYSTIESILGGSAAVSNFADSNPTDQQVKDFINQLRNSTLLKDAQITSYSYKPLVGMTSMTDAKGMTTTYEYDAFQRLKTVKDQNGNILKQTDYHYKN